MFIGGLGVLDRLGGLTGFTVGLEMVAGYWVERVLRVASEVRADDFAVAGDEVSCGLPGEEDVVEVMVSVIVFFMVVVLGWSVVVEAGYLVWCDCWKNKCNGNSQYGGPSLRSG